MLYATRIYKRCNNNIPTMCTLGASHLQRNQWRLDAHEMRKDGKITIGATIVPYECASALWFTDSVRTLCAGETMSRARKIYANIRCKQFKTKKMNAEKNSHRLFGSFERNKKPKKATTTMTTVHALHIIHILITQAKLRQGNEKNKIK